MNSKHTGFEFYKPLPHGARLGALGRKLTDAEFEGPLPDNGKDVLFRARKAVTKMTPLRFPRYLARDPRDYFYLTLKPVLPGPDLQVDGRLISFSTSGLPHSGWPHAFARAQIEEKDGSRTWLVRIDPLRGIPNLLADNQSEKTLAYLSGVYSGVKKLDIEALRYSGVEQEWAIEQGEIALYAVRGSIRLNYKVGRPEKGAHSILSGPALSRTKTATAAIGVDNDGFIVYAENESGDSATLSSRLTEAGVQQAIALPEIARLAFIVNGSAIDVSGSSKIRVSLKSSIAIHAEERAAAEVIFPDTKPKPYRVWGWLQGRRFRYFPTGTPRFPKPDLDEEM